MAGKDAKSCSAYKVDFNADKVIGCDGKCGGWFHLKCAQIKEKDYPVISSCKGLKWYCIDCRDKPEESIGINTVKDLISEALKTYANELQSLKTIINNMAANKTNVTVNKSYAQVMNQPAIIIKPKQNQNCTKTRQEIQNKINPADLAVGVSAMSNARNGGILLKCDKKEDATKLEKEVEKELGKNYEVKRSTLKNPHIKIIGIREKLNKDQIKSCILAQNDSVNEETANVIIKHTIELASQTIAIAEVDSTTFGKIMLEGKINVGWSRCRVFEDVRIWRCYNCAGFNHKSSECSKKLACTKCAGEHSFKDCKSEYTKCTNCITANNILKMKFDVNHGALDENCPVFKKKVDLQKKQIQYVAGDCGTQQ